LHHGDELPGAFRLQVAFEIVPAGPFLNQGQRLGILDVLIDPAGEAAPPDSRGFRQASQNAEHLVALARRNVDPEAPRDHDRTHPQDPYQGPPPGAAMDPDGKPRDMPWFLARTSETCCRETSTDAAEISPLTRYVGGSVGAADAEGYCVRGDRPGAPSGGGAGTPRAG